MGGKQGAKIQGTNCQNWSSLKSLIWPLPSLHTFDPFHTLVLCRQCDHYPVLCTLWNPFATSTRYDPPYSHMTLCLDTPHRFWPRSACLPSHILLLQTKFCIKLMLCPAFKSLGRKKNNCKSLTEVLVQPDLKSVRCMISRKLENDIEYITSIYISKKRWVPAPSLYCLEELLLLSRTVMKFQLFS